MANLTTEDRIMNGFLRVILDMELSAAERQVAAASLRSGDLISCLLHVLEFDDAKRREITAPTSVIPTTNLSKPTEVAERKRPRSEATMLQPGELFNLVRKRKVSKQALTEVVQRLNRGSIPGIDDDSSMRQIIEAFRDVGSDAEWITLTRAINGEIENDSYLSRILGR